VIVSVNRIEDPFGNDLFGRVSAAKTLALAFVWACRSTAPRAGRIRDPEARGLDGEAPAGLALLAATAREGGGWSAPVRRCFGQTYCVRRPLETSRATHVAGLHTRLGGSYGLGAGGADSAVLRSSGRRTLPERLGVVLVSAAERRSTHDVVALDDGSAGPVNRDLWTLELGTQAPLGWEWTQEPTASGSGRRCGGPGVMVRERPEDPITPDPSHIHSSEYDGLRNPP
jgi:hypothetical protein